MPGLILLADADNGKYVLEATGIENTDIAFPKIMYGHERSESAKSKDMLALQWHFYNTSALQMNAEYGISIPDDLLPDGFDLIETDYK